jgi:hypothetical protein
LAGAEAIARGDFVEVDDEELEQFLDHIDCWPIAQR